MSKNIPKAVTDGYGTITDGVNSNNYPQLLPRTQVAWASNTTFRNGLPQTRPGFRQAELTFLDQNGQEDATLRTRFEDGIFQGAVVFERFNTIIASIGGRMFRITPDSWNVIEITPTNAGNSELYRAWFCEADDFLIRQDGQTAAWIFDGGSTRESDAAGIKGTKEVPTGTAMVYSQGRIVVTSGNGRTFLIGDIVGGPSGTVQYGFRDSILKFTENDVINLGGSFSIPINAGKITAIRPVAQVDTSLGQGPTQIFSQNGIFSLNTPSDRSTWKTLTYPIQTFSVVQAGSASDRATINVNGDIWMRSLDGVRSFVVARRDFGSWVNAPQSAEMLRAVQYDDQNLLEYSSAIVFDNRLLMTNRPYRVFDHGVSHKGLLVLDFEPVASIGSQAKPVWEGVWSGLNFLQVFGGTISGDNRAFAFSLNADNKIELWEFTDSEKSDLTIDSSVDIEGFIETGGYSFPDFGFDQKKLDEAWFWPEDVQGSVTVGFQYRANNSVAWKVWDSKTFCSNFQSCDTTECAAPANLKPQFRRPYIIKKAGGTCVTATGVPSEIGEWFQVRMSFQGHLRFGKLQLFALETQQEVNRQACLTESCQNDVTCNDDGYTYSVY